MKSKWILITGASSGIGAATAQVLLQQGYNTVLSARNEQRLEEIVSPFSKENYHLISCDLSQLDQIKTLADAIYEKVGKISGVVHCAGVNKIIPINMAKETNIKELFEINTFAAIELVKQFSKKKMVHEDGSSMVLISSLAAHEGSMGNSIYAASKGALEGFLAPAAAELVKKNIRINIVVPGFVKTAMTDGFLKRTSQDQMENLKQQYPLGFGNPVQIANLIEFLISEKSDWVTGQKYHIDGGHMIHF